MGRGRAQCNERQNAISNVTGIKIKSAGIHSNYLPVNDGNNLSRDERLTLHPALVDLVGEPFDRDTHLGLCISVAVKM
jgi:hypothetical protein